MQFNCLVLCTTLATAWADIQVNYIRSCNDESTCRVTQMRFDVSCTNKKYCPFDRNTTLRLNVDYTPNFFATKLKSMVYWTIPNDMVGYPDMELPLSGSDNGCESSSCPTGVGRPQTFNSTTMDIGKKFALAMAPGPFRITWKLWNEQNESEVCCVGGSFLFDR